MANKKSKNILLIHHIEVSTDLYGVFTGSDYVSGDEEWNSIDIQSKNNLGLWRVTMTNMDGAGGYRIDAISQGIYFDFVTLKTFRSIFFPLGLHCFQ